MNDLDCFLLCQGYYRWSDSRGEGPSGAFVTYITYLVILKMVYCVYQLESPQ